MEQKAYIRRNKEGEQVYLDLLNNHFKTVTYEKYPDAMMNLMFSDARIKILGKNYRKETISRRKSKKIKDEVLGQMRRKYGKWVNITFFKTKGALQINFITNLDKVFTVPGHGRLYGARYHSSCGNIFFTSHSLDRFEERADPDQYAWLKNALRDDQNSEPTSVDLLCTMIMSGDFIYGRFEEYCHLYLPIGIIVLEDLGDVFIAKTFLSPKMVKPVKWYIAGIEEDEKDSLNSFVDVLNRECKPISQPPFLCDMVQQLGEVIDKVIGPKGEQ